MHVYVPWKLRLQSACQGASTGTNTHDQLKRTHISMTHCAICKLICNLLRPSRLWRQVCKVRPWYYVLPGCTREPSPLPAIHVDPPITGSVMPHLQLALTWPRQTRQHDLFLINCHGRRSNQMHLRHRGNFANDLHGMTRNLISKFANVVHLLGGKHESRTLPSSLPLATFSIRISISFAGISGHYL